MFEAFARRPISNLYTFRGRVLPPFLFGEVTPIDTSALDGGEFSQFVALLEKCAT